MAKETKLRDLMNRGGLLVSGCRACGLFFANVNIPYTQWVNRDPAKTAEELARNPECCVCGSRGTVQFWVLEPVRPFDVPTIKHQAIDMDTIVSSIEGNETIRGVCKSQNCGRIEEIDLVKILQVHGNLTLDRLNRLIYCQTCGCRETHLQRAIRMPDNIGHYPTRG